jgi:hypothetical protein
MVDLYPARLTLPFFPHMAHRVESRGLRGGLLLAVDRTSSGHVPIDAIDPKAISISFGDDERPKRLQTSKDGVGN